jgi:hypothetical protein
MIERAGRRIRVRIDEDLHVDDVRAAVATLTTLVEQIDAETPPSEVDPVAADTQAAIKDMHLYGADKDAIARQVARYLVQAGYTRPAR